MNNSEKYAAIVANIILEIIDVCKLYFTCCVYLLMFILLFQIKLESIDEYFICAYLMTIFQYVMRWLITIH